MIWDEVYERMKDEFSRQERFGTRFFVFEDVTDDVFPRINTYICEWLPEVVETDREIEIRLKDANRDRTITVRDEGHTWSWTPRQLKLVRYSLEFSETTSLDEFCKEEGL